MTAAPSAPVRLPAIRRVVCATLTAAALLLTVIAVPGFAADPGSDVAPPFALWHSPLRASAGDGQAAASARLPAQRDENASPCVLMPGKWADPTLLWLGDETTVTLTSTTNCPAQLIPLHVVLSIDTSLSMGDGKIDAASDAARRFVNKMDFTVSQVGLTTFDGEARINSQLTDQKGRILGMLGNLELAFGTELAGGIEMSRDVILRGRGRNRDETQPEPIEVIIVLSDGRPYPGGPGPVQQAASQAKAQGILIASVCVGGDCDQGLMRSVASRGDLFFDVRNSSGLLAVYDRLANQLLETSLRRLTITDELPDNMRYVPGSAVPELKESGPGWLRWEWTVLPGDGITITYRLEPLEEGIWPTSKIAVGDFRDTADRIGHMVFPTPTVEVRVPTPTVTPIATDTPTPTNTPSPTPTATLTPTGLPTLPPRPAFLPALLNQKCEPTKGSTDVVLVIDVSSSMAASTRDGGVTKREAARRAAQSFVRRLGPTDRVAVVVFSSEARALIPLTADRSAADHILETLPAEEGTRIDAGLHVATELLAHRRESPTVPAILLVTDGQPTRSSADDVRAAARRARESGLIIFAVGLGADVNPSLMREIAGDPSRYHEAPDADDLDGVYRRLAVDIPCPKGRPLPQR